MEDENVIDYTFQEEKASYATPIPESYKKKRNVKFTLEQLKSFFPEKKYAITQDTVDYYNHFVNDPEFDGVSLMDTVIVNKNAMLKNSASMESYLNAVRFSSFLHANDNPTQAYIKTFWHREFVQEALKARDEEGTTSSKYRQLCNAASRYKTQNPLVADILRTTLLDTSINYMGARKQAFGVLIDKMHNSRLDKDAIAAADTFLRHTAPPAEVKMELDIGVKESDSTKDMMNAIRAHISMQKEAIANGARLEDVQKLGLTKSEKTDDEVIDAEVTDGGE